MKMNAFTFYNYKSGKRITMYAKISDLERNKNDTYDIFRAKSQDLGVFDNGYVEVVE